MTHPNTFSCSEADNSWHSQLHYSIKAQSAPECMMNAGDRSRRSSFSGNQTEGISEHSFSKLSCRARSQRPRQNPFRRPLRFIVLAFLLQAILPFHQRQQNNHLQSRQLHFMQYSDARSTPHLTRLLHIPPGLAFDEKQLIRRAHSHNDYQQEDPLSSALRHGITSVEVDVFPRKQKLLVAHTRLELDESRTIDDMYIKPIFVMVQKSGKIKSDSNFHTKSNWGPFPQARTSKNQRRNSSRLENSHNDNHSGSRINHLIDPGDDDTLTLLVDLKANPDESVALLHEALAPLRPYLSKIDRNGKFIRGRVTVVISGNRPTKESLYYSPPVSPTEVRGGATRHNLIDRTSTGSNMDKLEGGERYMFIDGRARDIQSRTETDLVPMVSVCWQSMLLHRLLGRGEQYMDTMARRAHDQGKRLRIWGAPNKEKVWRQMMSSNVDLLSIDDHGRFASFASRFGYNMLRAAD